MKRKKQKRLRNDTATNVPQNTQETRKTDLLHLASVEQMIATETPIEDYALDLAWPEKLSNGATTPEPEPMTPEQEKIAMEALEKFNLLTAPEPMTPEQEKFVTESLEKFKWLEPEPMTPQQEKFVNEALEKLNRAGDGAIP
jgi:hypothetical protein